MALQVKYSTGVARVVEEQCVVLCLVLKHNNNQYWG